MQRKYLIHLRESLSPEQLAALLARFPDSRPSAKPHLYFLGGPSAAPRAIVDFAQELGLVATVVDL